VLPLIPNPPGGIPASYPPCGSLRGEPCRAVVSNGAPTNVRAAPNGTDAVVTWTAAVPRAGDAIGGYRVAELPGGRTLDVPGSPTSATTHIDHDDHGRHDRHDGRDTGRDLDDRDDARRCG
jgi:hypothetical protein